MVARTVARSRSSIGSLPASPSSTRRHSGVCTDGHGVISLAGAAAGWVGFRSPVVTPPANFHHSRDTTTDAAIANYFNVQRHLII